MDQTNIVLLQTLLERSWYTRLRSVIAEDLLPTEHNIVLLAIDEAMKKTESGQITPETVEIILESMYANNPEHIVALQPILKKLKRRTATTELHVRREALANYLEGCFSRKFAKQAAMGMGIDELSGEIEKARSLLKLRAGSATQTISSYATLEATYKTEALRPVLLGLSPDLDEYCSTAPGEIGIVEAQPNNGKTTVLVNIAANVVLKGGRVVFATADDPAFKIQRRFDQRFGGYTREAVEASTAACERAKDVVERSGGALYFIDATRKANGCRVADLVVDIETIGRHPNLLVVDYADKLRYRDSASEQDVAHVYDELVRLGARLGCSVWTGSQIRRTDYGFGNVELHSVAWSIAKSERAASIFAMMTNSECDAASMAYARILKTREGRPKERDIPLSVDWSRQTVGEWK